MKTALRWSPINDSRRRAGNGAPICLHDWNSMKLKDLAGILPVDEGQRSAASTSPGFRRIRATVAPGLLFFAAAGIEGRRRGLCRRCGKARRGGDRRGEAARRSAARRCRCFAVDDPRLALALTAARFFGSQPDNDGRRHRHQRQDVGRLLHPADLGAGRQCGGQHRHDRRRRARPQRIRRADHARSGRAAPAARANSPTPASPTPRWKPRATASTSAGSTASGSPPAPSPISAATTWTIIRRSRTIIAPSCACSTRCCRRARRR